MAKAKTSTAVAPSRHLKTIPQKLHLIWVGDEAKRPDRWIATWRTNHPNWEFRLWNNDDLRGEYWETKRQMEIMASEGAWSGVANLMRYELLHRYGGVYVDADSESVRPLDDWLLQCRLFAVWESELHRPGLIANTYIGSVAGHTALRRLIDESRRMAHPLRRFSWKKARYRKVPSWRSNGPVLFTRVLREFSHEAVTILPSCLFLPEHFAGAQDRAGGLVYARHYWGTTMQVKSRPGYELAQRD
jgi:mannosyltransferase OCH1-like enzyme